MKFLTHTRYLIIIGGLLPILTILGNQKSINTVGDSIIRVSLRDQIIINKLFTALKKIKEMTTKYFSNKANAAIAYLQNKILAFGGAKLQNIWNNKIEAIKKNAQEKTEAIINTVKPIAEPAIKIAKSAGKQTSKIAEGAVKYERFRQEGVIPLEQDRPLFEQRPITKKDKEGWFAWATEQIDLLFEGPKIAEEQAFILAEQIKKTQASLNDFKDIKALSEANITQIQNAIDTARARLESEVYKNDAKKLLQAQDDLFNASFIKEQTISNEVKAARAQLAAKIVDTKKALVDDTTKTDDSQKMSIDSKRNVTQSLQAAEKALISLDIKTIKTAKKKLADALDEALFIDASQGNQTEEQLRQYIIPQSEPSVQKESPQTPSKKPWYRSWFW